MIIYSLATLAALSGYLVGFIILIVAVTLFLIELGFNITTSSFLMISIIVLSIPISSLLAGNFLDRYCNNSKYKVEIFSILGLGMSSIIIINYDIIFNHLELLVASKDLPPMSLFLKVLTSTISVSIITAVLIMSIILIIEFFIRVFIRSFSLGYDLNFNGLRPLLVILLISSGFNFIIDFYLKSLL